MFFVPLWFNIMDKQTLKILEFQTVLGWLAEKAYSHLGAELLEALQPFDEPKKLEREVAAVAEVSRLLHKHEEPPLHGLRDLRKTWDVLRPLDAIAEPSDLVPVANFCETARRINQFFEHRMEDCPALCKIAEGVTSLPELEENIRRSFTPGGDISDDASPDIKRLRNEIQSEERNLQATLDKMSGRLFDKGHLSDSFYTKRNGRYVLPVKAGARGSVQGIVHDVSGSGETFFIEPMGVVERSNNLASLNAQLREECRRILLQISEAARQALPYLEENTKRLGRMDALATRARFGYENGWHLVEQVSASDRQFKLDRAHHPILRRTINDESIPLSFTVEQDDHALIISGPNAGGKTTTLKAVGLMIVMRQAAIPIPAGPNTKLPFWHKVLADIGDDQSITEGVSTFSSHVLRINSITRSAADDTLVLLDELGTATDPQEGGALAMAVLENLEQNGASIIATSHLASLKQWAHDHPNGRNCSFALEAKTNQPTFELQMDVPGVSEALTVAGQQGLLPSIVQRARELMPEGLADLSKLLKDIERQRRRANRKLKDAHDTRKRIRQSEEDLEKKLDRVRERQLNLERDFATEKEKWLREVRAEVEKKIAGLSEKKAMKEARQEIETLQEKQSQESKKLERKPNTSTKALQALQPGARVRVPSLNDEGEIVAINHNRNRATVALRNLNAEVKLEELEPLGAPEKPKVETRRVYMKARRAGDDVPPMIDLHGKRVVEALDILDEYLDKALLQDYPSVRVVHGHGTGALRTAIHGELRNHPQVSRFRFGNEGEGGGAVTIIEFKE